MASGKPVELISKVEKIKCENVKDRFFGHKAKEEEKAPSELKVVSYNVQWGLAPFTNEVSFIRGMFDKDMSRWERLATAQKNDDGILRHLQKVAKVLKTEGAQIVVLEEISSCLTLQWINYFIAKEGGVHYELFFMFPKEDDRYETRYHQFTTDDGKIPNYYVYGKKDKDGKIIRPYQGIGVLMGPGVSAWIKSVGHRLVKITTLDAKGRLDVTIMGVHLYNNPHRDQDITAKNAEMLCGYTYNYKPFVILGDFNADELQMDRQYLHSFGATPKCLNDYYVHRASLHPKEFKEKPGRIVDHVLYSKTLTESEGLMVENLWMVKEEDISDHPYMSLNIKRVKKNANQMISAPINYEPFEYQPFEFSSIMYVIAIIAILLMCMLMHSIYCMWGLLGYVVGCKHGADKHDPDNEEASDTV